MILHPDIQSAIDSGLISANFVMRIASDDRVRVWNGNGDLPIEADAIETEGGTYKGLGILGDIPGLEQLVNGTAQRLDVGVSGVSQYISNLVDVDAEAIRSRAVNFGLIFFGADSQQIGPVMWVAEYVIDVVKKSMVRSPVGEQRTFTISMATIMAGRRRPSFSAYTSAAQRRRSPTDSFCDRTPLYTLGTTLPWT